MVPLCGQLPSSAHAALPSALDWGELGTTRLRGGAWKNATGGHLFHAQMLLCFRRAKVSCLAQLWRQPERIVSHGP